MKQFLLLPALLAALSAPAQTNLDFETINYTGWTGWTGMPNGYTNPLTGITTGISPVGVNAYTSNSPHVIVNSSFSGITCNGGSPVGEGMYSGLINFTSGSNHGTAIEQTFTVTPGNVNFVYGFSAFLVDANHAATEEPFFRAEVFGPTSSLVYQNVIYPGMANSPLVSCNINSNYYTPWACDTVDLSAYLGASVTIRFTAADCYYGDHDGYAFIDAGCLITGQQEFQNTVADEVYPNPGDGLFFVRHSDATGRTLVVRSIDGKELLRSTSASASSWIDLREKAPGIYFLEIETAAGERTIKKLVKD